MKENLSYLEQREGVVTLEEFNARMELFIHELDDENLDYDEWENKVSTYQSYYMESVIEKYNATTKAQKVILKILTHAVRQSVTGSSVIDVYDEEVAMEVDNIIWNEIGDYLLDYEFYKESDHWVVDCIFAGNYVPYWDGWLD